MTGHRTRFRAAPEESFLGTGGGGPTGALGGSRSGTLRAKLRLRPALPAREMEPTESMPGSLASRLERWLAYPRSWNPRIRADGKTLFVLSNQDGVPKVWTVDAAGGNLHPFWSTDERVEAVLPSHHDPRVVVATDRGGNELWELSLVGEDGERIRRLTDRPDRIHQPGAWRDARRFLFSSNERDVRFFDVYECDVEAAAPGRLVRQEDALVSVLAAREEVALLERSNTNLDTDLFVLDHGVERHLNPHAGEVEVFSADLLGSDVYAATNPDREFTALVRYPCREERRR